MFAHWKYIFSLIYFILNVLQFSAKVRDVFMSHPVLYRQWVSRVLWGGAIQGAKQTRPESRGWSYWRRDSKPILARGSERALSSPVSPEWWFGHLRVFVHSILFTPRGLHGHLELFCWSLMIRSLLHKVCVYNCCFSKLNQNILERDSTLITRVWLSI